ncbi:Carboxypeptidase S1-like protein B [Lachnellula suecica]|uniref:Carboxypeptidase S1-like protein B n=1 Tax=Lachnellula suecica TaxID=602035 RepID=A0A8T9CDN4_9HELO|nr:Carboxypeptidase S1-like protein B [Lachnellula suecica]
MTSPADYAICTEAEDMCRDNVESPYYFYGGRGAYDIRHPYADPTPESYFVDYLNLPSTAAALGVDLNYTLDANNDVYYAFQETGDFIFPNFKEDLEMLLNNSVRVALIYGDADYICNWFGGEAVSLAVNYTYKEEFAASGYTPFMVDGDEYGEVRQYGNFSFLRVYESGHEVPYYQPKASLELFKRVLLHLDVADGTIPVTGNFSTSGDAKATHTNTFWALPSSTSAAAASSSTASATSAAPQIVRRKF